MYIDPQDNTWKVLRYYETSDGVFSIYVVPDPTMPTSKADCKNGGYKEFGYKNQGQCFEAVRKAS
jgi:hypothetical protein